MITENHGVYSSLSCLIPDYICTPSTQTEFAELQFGNGTIEVGYF